MSKSSDGRVEAIRALRAARSSAVKAKTQAANQLRALLLTAPDALRDRLRELSTRKLAAACVRLRPSEQVTTPETATKLAMRSVARRYRMLSEEIAELDARIEALVAEVAPGLICLPAVGVEAAATLLVVAGDNPERLKSEAVSSTGESNGLCECISRGTVAEGLSRPRVELQSNLIELALAVR